jgi:putative transposase
MADYIRAKVQGGTFFFSARLQDRHSDLLVNEIVLLRHAMRLTKSRHPFHIDSIVVLPAAIHTIWALPEGDADVSTRWSLLKRTFVANIDPVPHRTPAQIKRGEKGIWQRRFWEHLIRDADDLAAHRAMIRDAPVHAGLVARPQDWAWTSLHRDLAATHRTHNPHRPVGYSALKSLGVV